MSLQVRNQTSGALERVAGFNDTDSILSPSSKNPISNKAVYNALLQKIDKTVTDLINYYDKSQVYTKPEVRALIGSINTLTIEVVSELPTSEISTTTIYFVGPKTGTNNYDEYVYVGGNWVQIGDTTIDLSNYVTSANLTTVLQDYYTKSQADALFNDYYDKDTVDDLLDTKQNTLDFDNTPIAGSQNPVTSAGIKTALDNILITGNGGSIIKVHHRAGAAAAGNTVTASKGSYSVSSTFDVSGDAIIIGFGEIGDITITATNGSETGSTVINIPNFSVYTARVSYGLDYISWLIAGGVSPSYYDSLNEVLEDEEVVRRLMTIHTSVDYLATLDRTDDEMALILFNNDICAKWINLRDYALDTLYANTYAKTIMDEAGKYGYGEWTLINKVPKMSSNTAPYGEAITSGAYSSSYPAWQAFDQNTSTYWVSTAKVNQWIGYKFIEPICIKSAVIGSFVSSGDLPIKNFKIQYSNNGVAYQDVYTGLFPNANGNYVFNFDNNISAQYWRVFILDEYRNDINIQVSTVEFLVWGPKGNVPVMTSNTAPYGTAFASTYYQAQYDAFNAFNNNVYGLNAWRSSTSDNNRYVGYQFANPICLTGLQWLGSIDATDIFFDVEGYIEYSNDGTNWNIADTITMLASEGKNFNFVEISNDIYALYWRLRLNNYNRGYNSSPPTRSNCCFQYLQFYGREMKASIPAMTDYTVPYGTATESSLYSTTYNVVKALDQQGNSTWSHSTGGVPQWIGYEFVKPVIVKMARIKPYSGSDRSDNVTLKIQAFDNDTNTWIDLTDLDLYYGTIDKTSPINNVNAYSKYRIYSTDTNYVSGGSKWVRFNRVQLYGFDYSERDWDTDHPMKYLYDHGVEPTDVITSVANALNNTFIKEPSRLTINKTTTSAWNAMYPTNQIDITNYTLARAVSTDGTGINGVASLATCSNLSTGATDSYKVMATNLAPYHQYNNMANVNTDRWVTIGFSTNVTGNIAISEWWLE